MALNREAEPGTRVTVAISAQVAASRQAYEAHGRHGEVVGYDTVYRRYTVRLDGGEVIALLGVHLKREDLGYGRKGRRA